MMKFLRHNLNLLAWALSGLVAVLAIVTWGQGLRWQLSNLSAYRLFPLFGLLAFSLIWSMYVVGLARRYLKPTANKLASYYKYLSLVALVLILAHPGLLIWQLWRDGFGLPPNSYKTYVGSAAVWAVIVSSVAWFIFLAYELRRIYRDRPWWKYMEIAGDVAMIGIFFHSLRLGTNLQAGWFRIVWLAYGLILAVVVFDIYRLKLSNRQPAKS
ncbi:hypothetical protein A3F05_01575 [Candidatus Saccharibacteria bacterium RIFCSPHIGHO2_12_FULL_47_17]|nr:MAG: hypothetical protein A3F05_01575 [Candidatus Saccharibacteria bacterium RIFCSPHIGHO2_12_FULL_47_17]